eukprot:2086494-Amphidinium_carterae.1
MASNTANDVTSNNVISETSKHTNNHANATTNNAMNLASTAKPRQAAHKGDCTWDVWGSPQASPWGAANAQGSLR